ATDDSVRAQNRATALHCVRFDSRLGPHELTIPAVRSPGGSLVYFVPAASGSGGMFESDFDLGGGAPNAPDNGAGLTCVDHVAMGLPSEALDTWILFCRAVLGMETGESLELSDPFGLVRSCGVATDDRAVRMVLNVSQSRSTQMARAVAAQRGASVHHIAFATDDIFATMTRLAGNGAKFVAISPNYYDDLESRFDLAPDLVARMRVQGIVYERTADGEYFHAYSQRFGDRFFFEIVQRGIGYDGYGAQNAAARLAAQVAGEP
ncbi:MAG: VOC family protein, partial [Casimicrobiaceae bacterium]